VGARSGLTAPPTTHGREPPPRVPHSDSSGSPAADGPVAVAASAPASGHRLLARNTAWMALGQGSRIILGAAYFVIIARTLGPDEYGAFVGAVALVALASPFASLGAGNLLVKHVARAPELFSRYWGGALSITLVSGIALGGVVLFGGRVFLPRTIPMSLVLGVAAADLVCTRVIDISAQAFQAHEKMARTGQFPFLLSLLRLVAAIIFARMGHPTAARWAAWYFASAIAGAVVSVGLAWRELSGPARVFGYPAAELREGVYFATSLSAQNVYNDIDKSMLARLSTLQATGIYGAAYRLIEVSFVPVRSLLFAAYPRFFRSGAAGLRSSLTVTRQLLPLAAGYGALAGIALFVGAPLLPRLLGQEYVATVAAVRLLATLPLLKAIHYFAADALTGAGYQGRRTTAQVAVAIVNIAINVPLITLASWRGAAWASVASDGLLAVLMWWTVWAMCRREDRQRADATPSLVPAPAVART
jgi:O-antigen/teichoic acid export membrane protein